MVQKIARALVLTVAFAGAIAFIAMQLPALWSELKALREQEARIRASTVVGYIDVNPQPSYAARPEPWIRVQGDTTKIWGGWGRETGHRWFEFPTGQFDTTALHGAFGRDIIRAVHKPIVETRGGVHWERIPWDAEVISFIQQGEATAYPQTLLQLARIVLDQPAERPVLLIYWPEHRPDSACEAFDPTLDGKVVKLGSSGYYLKHDPILYDSGTESLWCPGDAGLVAIAGARKGAVLPRIARLKPVSWGHWTRNYPRGRLIVGADRSISPLEPAPATNLSLQ
jgi:hypothetical protein